MMEIDSTVNFSVFSDELLREFCLRLTPQQLGRFSITNAKIRGIAKELWDETHTLFTCKPENEIRRKNIEFVAKAIVPSVDQETRKKIRDTVPKYQIEYEYLAFPMSREVEVEKSNTQIDNEVDGKVYKMVINSFTISELQLLSTEKDILSKYPEHLLRDVKTFCDRFRPKINKPTLGGEKKYKLDSCIDFSKLANQTQPPMDYRKHMAVVDLAVIIAPFVDKDTKNRILSTISRLDTQRRMIAFPISVEEIVVKSECQILNELNSKTRNMILNSFTLTELQSLSDNAGGFKEYPEHLLGDIQTFCKRFK